MKFIVTIYKLKAMYIKSQYKMLFQNLCKIKAYTVSWKTVHCNDRTSFISWVINNNISRTTLVSVRLKISYTYSQLTCDPRHDWVVSAEQTLSGWKKISNKLILLEILALRGCEPDWSSPQMLAEVKLTIATVCSSSV